MLLFKFSWFYCGPLCKI